MYVSLHESRVYVNVVADMCIVIVNVLAAFIVMIGLCVVLKFYVPVKRHRSYWCSCLKFSFYVSVVSCAALYLSRRIQMQCNIKVFIHAKLLD